MSATIIADVLEPLVEYFEKLPDVANQAMAYAINDSATRVGLKRSRDIIADQFNLSKAYLSDPSRLGLTKKATKTDLEATITARARATSLARYAVGDMTPGLKRPKGVMVEVKSGNSKIIRKAFPIRLKRGASLTEDNYNLGLAIRLKPGERIINKNQMSASEVGHGIYLLYGPSVDQIFRSVADDVTPEVVSSTTSEFLRQLARLIDG